MFALHVFRVSALLVTTALFCCTGQLLVRAPPSASLRRGGNTACAQAVVLARLLGLMHVCFACICCCLCFLLPIRSRKSVPCCRFALCDMNLFMCFVLPSLLLSKSRRSDRIQICHGSGPPRSCPPRPVQSIRMMAGKSRS